MEAGHWEETSVNRICFYQWEKNPVLFKLARNMFLYVKYVIVTGCCGKVYCRVQSWQGAVPKCKILTVPSALGMSSRADACTLSRMLEGSGLGEQGLAWEGWMQDHRGKLARHPSGGVLGLGVNCQTGRAFSWWDAGHLCTASSWWDVEAGRDMPAIQDVLVVRCWERGMSA